MGTSIESTPGVKYYRAGRRAGLRDSRVTIPPALRPAFGGKVQHARPLGRITHAETIAAHAKHESDCAEMFARLARLSLAQQREVIAGGGLDAFARGASRNRAMLTTMADGKTFYAGDIADASDAETLAYVRAMQPDPAYSAELDALRAMVARQQAIIDQMRPPALAQHDPNAPATWTVRNLYDRFLNRPEIGIAIKRHHRTTLDAFMRYLGADPVAREVTPLQCALFIEAAQRQTTPKLLPSTIGAMIKSLRALFNYGAKLGAIARGDNPASFLKKPADKRGRSERRRGFTRTELESMVAKARETWCDADPRTLALRLILFTGARRSEIVNLSPAALINHPDGGLCVHVRLGKTANADRILPVHARLAEALEAYAATVAPTAPYLFATLPGRLASVRADAFATAIRRELMDALSLPGAPTLAPCHSFRYAMVTETRNLPGAVASEDVKRYISGHADGSERAAYGEQPLGVVRAAVDAMWGGCGV